MDFIGEPPRTVRSHSFLTPKYKKYICFFFSLNLKNLFARNYITLTLIHFPFVFRLTHGFIFFGCSFAQPSFERHTLLNQVTRTNRRGFAEVHPTGRSRRVLVLYTGGTIGMCPSKRGYVCEAGYLPKLLKSLPMFHDANYDLSQEDLPPGMFQTSIEEEVQVSSSVSEDEVQDKTRPKTRPTTTPTTPTNPSSKKSLEQAQTHLNSSHISTATSTNCEATALHRRGSDSNNPNPNPNIGSDSIHNEYSISDPLITPVSEYGRRTVYCIKEYQPLLDSCNMVSSDWARLVFFCY